MTFLDGMAATIGGWLGSAVLSGAMSVLYFVLFPMSVDGMVDPLISGMYFLPIAIIAPVVNMVMIVPILGVITCSILWAISPDKMNFQTSIVTNRLYVTICVGAITSIGVKLLSIYWQPPFPEPLMLFQAFIAGVLGTCILQYNLRQDLKYLNRHAMKKSDVQ